MNSDSPRRFSYLLISYTYPPVLGGSEIEAQRVSEALQKRGHKMQIICGGGGPMPPVKDWVDPCGLRVRLYGAKWPAKLRGYVYAIGVAWSLFKERNNYDIAYFLMQGIQLSTGIPVAALLGKSIVMKFSCSGEVALLGTSRLGRFEAGLLRRWADRILVLNPGMKQEAKEMDFDLERVGWMPNPVDADRFHPVSPDQRALLRRKLDLSPDTPTVVFVGRLHPQKKLHWLIDSFARVVQQQPKAVLALIGDGALRDELSQQVQSLGLENNVRFTGRVSSDGVLEWLQAGDVFTLVSAVEGLPCSLIEAMSVGITPVVSDIPAHSQTIDNGVHGLLTAVGDLDDTARGLLRALGDADLRASMGAACRTRVLEVFATSKVVNCYEDLFLEMVNSPRAQ